MLIYFNFEPNFKLRWCRARDLFGSQIPTTTPSQFEIWLEVEVSQDRSATSVLRYRIRVLRIRITY